MLVGRGSSFLIASVFSVNTTQVCLLREGKGEVEGGDIGRWKRQKIWKSCFREQRINGHEQCTGEGREDGTEGPF